MEPSALLIGGLSTIPSLPRWDAPMHRGKDAGRDPAYLLVELQYLRVGFASPIARCRGVFPEDVAGDVAEAGWVRGVLGTGGRGPLGNLTAHRDQQVSASLGGLPVGLLGARRQQQAARAGRVLGAVLQLQAVLCSASLLPQFPLADLTPLGCLWLGWGLP